MPVARLARLARYPLLVVDEVGYIRLVHWLPGTVGFNP
jgi:hypothetical protein